MSNNDHQAEEMQEYFERTQKYWSEGKLDLEGLIPVVEEAAGIEIDHTSEANMILGRMWEVVASSVVVKGVLIERQEDTAKIYDAADVYVKKAISCYERFVTTHPNSAEAHEALGSAYWSQDLEKALAEYELALKYDPNNPDHKASIKHAKKCIGEGKPARDSRGTLWSYFVADSFMKVVPVEKMEACIEESFNKGLSLYDEGKYEESIEYFNESLELSHKLSREFTQVWYFKGHSLGRLGRKEEAIDCFEEVLSRAKDPDDLMEIHGHLGHLILFGTLGEPKYIPTKDDLSDDELKKALKHLNEGFKVFEGLSVEKKQEWANLYEPLEKLRELAENLIIQKGDDSKAKELLSMAISERSDNILEEDVKNAEEPFEKATVTISVDAYKGVRMLKAEISAKKGKALSWDEFFEQLLNRERKERDLTSWIYTLGIFVTITFILMFPLYIGAPFAALAMLPVFILIGLIVAFFSAYVLISWTLRGIKPFENAPPGILKSFKELSGKAGLEKPPELMIVETPEINAMAYVCLSGNRVCVTRGLMNAYQNENIGEGELNAVLGHEIGHIKNRDCLKWSFVLSWVSIFDMIGTVCIIVGTAISGIGIALEVGASREEKGGVGMAMAVFGWVLLISGFIQKVIAKIASILAFHLSRKNEHAADMVRAELTSPETMANALQRINTLDNELVAKELASLPYADRWQLQPRNPSWIDKLFDTHPPMEERENELRTISKFL